VNQFIERQQGWDSLPRQTTFTNTNQGDPRVRCKNLFSISDRLVSQVKGDNCRCSLTLGSLHYSAETVSGPPYNKFHVIAGKFTAYSHEQVPDRRPDLLAYIHFMTTHTSWIPELKTHLTYLNHHALGDFISHWLSIRACRRNPCFRIRQEYLEFQISKVLLINMSTLLRQRLFSPTSATASNRIFVRLKRSRPINFN
jgi:hypothetical protein